MMCCSSFAKYSSVKKPFWTSHGLENTLKVFFSFSKTIMIRKYVAVKAIANITRRVVTKNILKSTIALIIGCWLNFLWASVISNDT